MAMPAAQAQGPDEFELARRRAQQQVTAATQAKTDAIKRRMSAAGALNSGAAIKQEQIAHDEGQQQLQQATEQVDAAERAEFRRRREVQEGRDFARSEREASQQFASGESRLGREFTAGESALGRRFQEQMQGQQFGFTADQARLGREFQTSERLGQQTWQEGMVGQAQGFAQREREATQAWQGGQADKAFQQQVQLQHGEQGFQREMQQQQLAQAQRQFDQQMALAERQFQLDGDVTAFNRRMAEAEANKKSLVDKIAGAATLGASSEGGFLQQTARRWGI